MNITHGATAPSKASPVDTFEEVDVPAIQAEIQDRKLDKLPADNLFSREVAGQGTDDGVIDATVSVSPIPNGDSIQPQVVETVPGRPASASH
jgi:hypothetical protein